MKVKALAPWFGGKRTLAPEIVKQLGAHRQYFEPFCGSMAVLFAKQRSQKETANDLHGDLVNLARVVQDRESAEQLYDRLARTLFSEGLLEEAKHILADDWANELASDTPVGIDRAYWYFLASWMGRNGTAGTARQDYQIAVRWTQSGGSPTVRWRNAVDSLPQWHERLRNVVILRRDAFRILDRFEDADATAIYVDPPYVIDGKSRSGVKSRGDSSHTYKFEFNHEATIFEQDDHERLRDVLNEYKQARIVVSYYDCPRVRELYDGWTFLDHARAKHLCNVGGRSAAKAPEVLIVNGKELT